MQACTYFSSELFLAVVKDLQKKEEEKKMHDAMSRALCPPC
jgi:hypothetical protein